MTPRRRFRRIAGAGISFQAGSSAVDSTTVMSALVFQLTGNVVAVSAVPTILRLGWLIPQIFIGYFAGRSGSSMPFYIVGAFGRTAAIAMLALVLWRGSEAGWPAAWLGAATLVLWTLYACLSGVVGVPYNDIVARSIPSGRRSRMLAIRFFGGGVFGLLVAVISDHLLKNLEFPASFVAILSIAAVLMLVSSVLFATMGEPPQTAQTKSATRFVTYLEEGFQTFRMDKTFRRFVFAQWCGGGVLIAAPFYILVAAELGVGFENAALLMGAQTGGALLSNPLWGWWGDHLGKLSLMRTIAIARIVPPLAMIALLSAPFTETLMILVLLIVFACLGALSNGLTIAVIGLLMEISPDDRRPAYSGYFNALTSPAYLLPLLGGLAFAAFGAISVLLCAVFAGFFQAALLSSVYWESGR